MLARPCGRLSKIKWKTHRLKSVLPNARACRGATIYTTRHIINRESSGSCKNAAGRALARFALAVFVFHFAGDFGRQSSNRQADVIQTSRGELRITPVYHGSVMLEFGGKVIHVDPWSQGDFTGLAAGGFDCDHAHAPGPSGSRDGRQAEEAGDHYRRAAGRHRYAELRAGLRHRRGDQRFRTEDGDGHRIRGRPDVQPGVWIGAGKTVSPQGNWKRLRFEFWRHARLFFGRHGMHAGNESAEKY